MIRLAIALLLTVVSSAVMAANWVTLGEPRRGYAQIAIDLDSVRAKSESGRFVEVTWRSVGGTPHEVDSVLDCEEVSITNKVMRQASGQKTITTDFSAPPTDKFDAESKRGLRYWYPEWRNAQLLREVCPRFNPNWEENFLIRRPAAVCQSAKSFYEKQICSGSREALGEYGLMAVRLAQLQPRCSITQESLEKIISFFIDKVNQCKDESCLSTVNTNEIFSPTEKALQASMNGDKCTFVDDQLAAMERWARENKALADARGYRQCAMESVPLLDDGISGAETVAAALHAKCNPILVAAYAQTDKSVEFMNALVREFRPYLIELVLQHRAAKRLLQETQKGSKKNNPQSKPDRPKMLEM